MSENQLEILVQPIVNLPQKRVAFYECIPCVTLDNGMIINLNTYSGTSKNLPSNQAIEKMILFQTLQFVRRHHVTHPNHGFVCTLSPTLYKDIHALEEFFEFLHKTHFPFHGLIFEVPLDISASQLQHLLPLKNYGVRIMGKWTDTDLPTNLTELPSPPVDFIVLPYSKLSAWLNKQPRRKGLESLSQILEITPMTIISHVEKEQDLYHRLPVTFDFAIGSAFGLTKPFYHIQS